MILACLCPIDTDREYPAKLKRRNRCHGNYLIANTLRHDRCSLWKVAKGPSCACPFYYFSERSMPPLTQEPLGLVVQDGGEPHSHPKICMFFWADENEIDPAELAD